MNILNINIFQYITNRATRAQPSVGRSWPVLIDYVLDVKKILKCAPYSCLVVCVFVTHVAIVRFQRPCEARWRHDCRPGRTISNIDEDQGESLTWLGYIHDANTAWVFRWPELLTASPSGRCNRMRISGFLRLLLRAHRRCILWVSNTDFILRIYMK